MARLKQNFSLQQQDKDLMEVLKGLLGLDFSAQIREALRYWAMFKVYPTCDTEGRRQLWELLEELTVPTMKGGE